MPASARRNRSWKLLATAMAIAAFVTACGGGTEGELAAELVNEGLTLHADQRGEEAARKYREALVHDPANKFALFNLGVIAQERGEVARAELYYELALVSDTSFKPALFNLAIVVAARSKEDAVTVYERLLDVDPNNASAHLNLGFLLRELGERSEAKEHLDRAVELDPTLEARVSGGRDAAADATPEP